MHRSIQRWAEPEHHLVMFSGGKGSWAAAKRVAAKHGTENLKLVFADTKMEDPDLYRFLEEAAADVGGELVHLTEGRDPWQVFFDRKFLGNSRIDPCSEILKRKFLRTWLEENHSPFNTRIYLGIDWTEEHRFRKAIPRWVPWHIEAPMCQEPLTLPDKVFGDMIEAGIKPPRLYEMGFPHNNCGGFCVKAGISHFVHLLDKMPDNFARHEAREQEFRTFIGKDVSILKDRTKASRREHIGLDADDDSRDGELPAAVPLTMTELRERVEADPDRYQGLDEWGGCGCFSA